ncbi:hypothetical protein BCV71DRAFT_236480 [Rhizopus microsporus]|uniref:Uncharacterized protein n=1 Tax=Rhizopus microsporus TaxID=58291 RepID=A0A1X0RX75_RHIZD|nr:hypothetical protein BCV71DRAFT_236480 [Rhizopus microsporus]
MFYLGRSCSLCVDRLVYVLSQVVALDYWQDTIKAAHVFAQENVYQCRSFTESILFYEMDTKEGFLKNCSCPDQAKMYRHIYFLVSRVTKLPFSPRTLAPVVQQERLDTSHDNQDLLCHELLESADQNIRILLAKQLKNNPEAVDNLVSTLRQSISIVENVCFVPRSRPARQQ